MKQNAENSTYADDFCSGIANGRALNLELYMLRFNPKWDMHWLRTKQNREWFASKACSQNSGFSYG